MSRPGPDRPAQADPTKEPSREAGATALDEDAALDRIRAQPEVAEWLEYPGCRVRIAVTDRDARLFHVKVEVERSQAQGEGVTTMTLLYEVDRQTGEVTKVEL